MCGYHSNAPHWGPGHNPGMCPYWELNWVPFGPQAQAQSTELHQPGLIYISETYILSKPNSNVTLCKTTSIPH